MKNTYLELMERVLSAYSNEAILSYFEKVKKDGLTEHGFPRLTANIGILIAKGRRGDLLPVFCEMMEFCCKTIPEVKAANDFSVREIVCCIAELEKSSAVHAGDLERWKGYLRTINPETCYSVFAKTPTDPVKNWALFTGVSEFYRQRMGLCDSEKFIDIQLESQLQWLDENGMYMDHVGDVHHPMVYDLVPRGLFCLLLFAGYRGKHYGRIDACLKKAGLLTLKMQSVTGELAFGGRSNQFLHNEAWLAAIFEYEAVRYHRERNPEMAGQFKAAAQRALGNMEYWLAKQPISHVKNRFPTNSMVGCEEYAYFDKYMITAASFLYAAHLFCDDGISAVKPEETPEIWCTSEHFHKIFAKAGGYFLEFDTNSDSHYDASGLGRVHKKGAPSVICLSVPCPGEPGYGVDLTEPMALSLCPGTELDGQWRFAVSSDCTYTPEELSRNDRSARVTLKCRFGDGTYVTANYTVDETGVEMEAWSAGLVAWMLPAFCFDGESYTDITYDEKHLTVSCEGWQCRYTTSGTIVNTEKLACNRNGHYRIFRAEGRDRIVVKIEIF